MKLNQRGDHVFSVGSSAGIEILAPRDSYLSYLNSPYVGHSLGAAVDVYPSHQKWSGLVFSPITGTVKKIQRIRMGSPKPFPTAELDYAIGIEPEGRDDYLVRVLHCRPTVSVAETIAAGESIGSCIRSRFFNYWTGPHYHVEILSGEVFSRSTKSLPLELPVGNVRVVRPSEEREHICTVILSEPGRLVCVSNTLPIARSGPFLGHMVRTSSGHTGLVDGGIPHYKRGGALIDGPLEEDEAVTLWQSQIGTIIDDGSSPAVFATNRELKVFVNDERALGLSLFLYPTSSFSDSEMPIVVIPREFGAFCESITPGDTISLKIVERSLN